MSKFGTYEDTENRTDLGNGFTTDGKVAGDYSAAGRDPNRPRQHPDEIMKIIKEKL